MILRNPLLLRKNKKGIYQYISESLNKLQSVLRNHQITFSNQFNSISNSSKSHTYGIF